MSDYKVARLDEIEQMPNRDSKLLPVRHHLGITAFGINAWTADNAGDRVINEHAEDQPDDPEELYVVVRGRARFEVGEDTFDAPEGTYVFVPPGPRRTAFAEEPGTTVLAIGATPGKPYEVFGWEAWAPFDALYRAGDYEGAIEQGREPLEASGYGVPLYNLACCEALAGRKDDAIGHLRTALERTPRLHDLAKEDTDLDSLREEPEFKELVG
jgi:mannose-6-phosphate isomerase-like protein (cupin superfamily)